MKQMSFVSDGEKKGRERSVERATKSNTDIFDFRHWPASSNLISKDLTTSLVTIPRRKGRNTDESFAKRERSDRLAYRVSRLEQVETKLFHTHAAHVLSLEGIRRKIRSRNECSSKQLVTRAISPSSRGPDANCPSGRLSSTTAPRRSDLGLGIPTVRVSFEIVIAKPP